MYFTVEHQHIKRTDDNYVVAGSMNYLYANFTFTKEWNANIIAIFASKCGTYAQLLKDGRCLVPYEALKQDGRIDVSVCAGDLITSDTAGFIVHETGYTEDAEKSITPPPTILSDIYDRIEKTFINAKTEALQEVSEVLENYLKLTDVDSDLVYGSSNPVASGAVYNKFQSEIDRRMHLDYVKADKEHNGGNRNASADFFVDDTQVLQVNDYNKFYTWHCGDGKGKYGITNRNSVGIEICVNSDGNYDIVFCKAVELTKYLMKELNIPLAHVVRHYDASRKNCPASMSKNNWALWNTFKKSLTINEEDLTVAQYDELKNEIENIRTDVDKLKNKMVYAWVDDNMPDWAQHTITKLMRKGYLKGDNEGKLMLDDNMLRILVINDRAGIYGE